MNMDDKTKFWHSVQAIAFIALVVWAFTAPV